MRSVGKKAVSVAWWFLPGKENSSGAPRHRIGGRGNREVFVEALESDVWPVQCLRVPSVRRMRGASVSRCLLLLTPRAQRLRRPGLPHEALLPPHGDDEQAHLCGYPGTQVCCRCFAAS